MLKEEGIIRNVVTLHREQSVKGRRLKMTDKRRYYKDEIATFKVVMPITIRKAPTDVWDEDTYLIDVDGCTLANYNLHTNDLTFEGNVFPKQVVALIREKFGKTPRVTTGLPY